MEADFPFWLRALHLFNFVLLGILASGVVGNSCIATQALVAQHQAGTNGYD